MNQVQTENKMGTMEVKKLVVSMSLPMMLSMLIQSLYNVVDSIFVSKVSEQALTAVSMAFPIQLLMISIGSGIGVGMNALLSKRLGEKDLKGANEAAGNGIFLSLCACLIFMCAGLVMPRVFMEIQTKIPVIVTYGRDYLTICTVCSIGIFTQFTFERLLQATGRATHSMLVQLCGAVTNLVLDPVLIFGLGPFPRMEVQGAAAATVIGQLFSGIVGIWVNHTYNREISFGIAMIRPRWVVIRQIFAVGIPSAIMTAIGSVLTFGLNKILITFSATAVAVYGAYYKLQSFVMMPVFGMCNGIIPIIAFNYGAKYKQRIYESIRFSLGFAIGVMGLGLVVMQVFPRQLLGLFDASSRMLSIGVPALRVISLCFVFAAIGIILSAVFQAFGKGVYSMIISIVRQLVLILPVAYLLSLTGNVDWVWAAFPISEICSALLCGWFLYRLNDRLIKPMKGKT